MRAVGKKCDANIPVATADHNVRKLGLKLRNLDSPSARRHSDCWSFTGSDGKINVDFQLSKRFILLFPSKVTRIVVVLHCEPLAGKRESTVLRWQSRAARRLTYGFSFWRGLVINMPQFKTYVVDAGALPAKVRSP